MNILELLKDQQTIKILYTNFKERSPLLENLSN